ncbi:hypothetical protein A9D14_11320 [Croceicoccus marinus]|uniref:Uncharacterized protein n=1 Tax=Croceicoccus marinus TaxID=450378 RepID=A0A1Z1FD95_9SPHN|nr:hypothetical protein A9D14_11320 [Croceicoccus marinus]
MQDMTRHTHALFLAPSGFSCDLEIAVRPIPFTLRFFRFKLQSLHGFHVLIFSPRFPPPLPFCEHRIPKIAARRSALPPLLRRTDSQAIQFRFRL